MCLFYDHICPNHVGKHINFGENSTNNRTTGGDFTNTEYNLDYLNNPFHYQVLKDKLYKSQLPMQQLQQTTLPRWLKG